MLGLTLREEFRGKRLRGTAITKLLFHEEENPRAKLMAYARNDMLFADGADQAQLARQVRYVIESHRRPR